MNKSFRPRPEKRKRKTNTPVSPQNRRPSNRQSGSKPSTLAPSLFVKKAVTVEKEQYCADRTIEQLPLARPLIDRLIKKGFQRPTEIQDKTLEHLLEGRDLLGLAQTGTGKTGAFLMPIIDQMLAHKSSMEHALIVVPTRELAIQVNEEFLSMTKGLKLYSACFIGGVNINRDIQALRRPSHIVIGTPGRLLDLNKRGVLDFTHFHTLVLDEFDRMLDMGFARDMDHIIREMDNRKQTMLFSATLDRSQEVRIGNILHDPVHVKVSEGNVSGDHIDQDVVEVGPGEDKFGTLCKMLNQQEFAKVLLFDETKHRVNRLCEKLNDLGIKSDQIQGNKSQNARQKALKSFKEGTIQVLVATDVAARGIDVDDITHVINYQKPKTIDSYIHRIGRTGRAGKKGKAFTFIEA